MARPLKAVLKGSGAAQPESTSGRAGCHGTTTPRRVRPRRPLEEDRSRDRGLTGEEPSTARKVSYFLRGRRMPAAVMKPGVLSSGDCPRCRTVHHQVAPAAILERLVGSQDREDIAHGNCL